MSDNVIWYITAVIFGFLFLVNTCALRQSIDDVKKEIIKIGKTISEESSHEQ